MPSRCVAVAVSGGRDSIALLHATLRAAAPAGLRVAALHVHHGLQPQADDWLAGLQSRCARWAREGAALSFLWRRLLGAPASGESVEAWARRGRYAALGEMAREAGASLVLLAHHRRDQAETFVLQALRGGGAAGLAAMPRSATRNGLTWARPWLDMPRETVEAYVRRHRLRHVDDASNDDPRFARNRLRLQVWPGLLEAFPDAEGRLAGAARRAQQEAACLEELAQLDLGAVEEGGELVVDRWLVLSEARRANALRTWLRSRLGRGASDALVERLLAELPRGRKPARWEVDGAELRRYRGRLAHASAAGVPGAAQVQVLSIEGPGLIPLPAWGGSLQVELVPTGGIALHRLAHARLQPREGGEQFQRTPKGTARSLKKQYQAAGLAAWERGGPLLYCGEQLVFVTGLGVDARALAPAGVPQVNLRWLPDAKAASGNP
jgi:tRNA(Ile)-lysidine synthase